MQLSKNFDARCASKRAAQHRKEYIVSLKTTFISALVACLSYCVFAGADAPSSPAARATDKLAAATDEQISQAAKDAYVIVVAQIGDTPLGLGDRTIFDPAVQKKPTILRDAHHVTVDKTLKGADLAGLDLLVDPMTSFDLQKGKCYVLFLAPAQGQDRTCFKLTQMFYPAQPLLLEASDENIAAVKKAVAAQGSQVQAKRLIYMERVKEGYLVHRFVLLDDGTFSCLSRAPGLPGGVPREPDTLVGKATKDEVKSLAKSVHDAFEAENVRLAGSAAGPGPAKTGTAADFEFVDDENKLEHKLFSDPGVAPASSIIAAVDKLVADKGKAPEETASPASAPATQASHPAQLLVSMTYTGSWGAGVLRSFMLHEDGSFTWVKGGKGETSPQTLVGKLGAADVKSLVGKIQAAGKGPVANDTGYMVIQFVNSDGKLEKKNYFKPSDEPAASLLALIDELAQKNGKSDAATKPATNPS